MKMKTRLTRLWLQMTNDRKQFGVFCGLLLVGLLLWARIIVIARPPRTAIAVPSEQATVASNIASDNHEAAYPIWLDQTPMRDPFQVSEDAFPIRTETTDNHKDHVGITGSGSEQEAVAALELEAIMGDIAMINGRVFGIGDVLSPPSIATPLVLEKVHRRSVIIFAGDRRYELTIAPPRR